MIAAPDAVNLLDEIDEPYHFPTIEESAAEDIRVMAGLVPDLAAILDSVEAFLSRFVAYPDKDSLVAHVLWIAHTWSMETWDSTPRLAFLSPEPGSGKTRALEVTELLVPNALHSVSATPAYLFRKVADQPNRPTVLYDEIDALFGQGSTKTLEAADVRGMVNAGHRKGAMAGRCVVRGKIVETEELPSYCAVAMAGLRALPDTLMTRSIVIRMKRRSATETIEPFRIRDVAEEAAELAERLAVFARYVPDKLPELPEGIEDRDADVWEAVIAVADTAGGTWSQRARVSAVAFVSHSRDDWAGSLNIRLLSDLRRVFGEGEREREYVFTKEILDSLVSDEESPWGNIYGRPLTARGLATRLHGYGVNPRQVRIGMVTGKGYARADLFDPWERYLPSLIPEKGNKGNKGDIDLESSHSVSETTLSGRVTSETESDWPRWLDDDDEAF